MSRAVVVRLSLLPVVMLGMSVVVFLIMSLIPGDPALAILGPYATPESLADLRAELGLDRSLPERYLGWLGDVLHGELGRSVSLDRPVLDELLERVGPTLLLAGTALVLATLLGVTAGMLAAIRHGRWPDRVITLAVLVGISTPSFWLAMLSILTFSVWLGWLPVSGMRAVYGASGALDVIRHLLLPAVSLALVAAGVIARLTRTAALEVFAEGFLTMGRALGLSERQVLWRHALRSVLVQVAPVIGLQAGFVLGGAVYIETVFQWPGLGRMLVDAIAARDLLLVQGGVLFMGTGYVLVNLITDLAQKWLDPRIQL